MLEIFPVGWAGAHKCLGSLVSSEIPALTSHCQPLWGKWDKSPHSHTTLYQAASTWEKGAKWEALQILHIWYEKWSGNPLSIISCKSRFGREQSEDCPYICRYTYLWNICLSKYSFIRCLKTHALRSVQKQSLVSGPSSWSQLPSRYAQAFYLPSNLFKLIFEPQESSCIWLGKIVFNSLNMHCKSFTVTSRNPNWEV